MPNVPAPENVIAFPKHPTAPGGRYATISMCVITGNEEAHVERFLKAFSGAFDELCMVRAVGRTAHDRTVGIAKKWCEENGKVFRFAEYRNVHLPHCHPDAPEVLDDDPATWPHVDDFAAARNMAWSLATCEWQLWGDLDDVITDADAATIRRVADDSTDVDLFFFHYSIPSSGESNYRERLFRTGNSHWSQPVHENCHVDPDKALVPGSPRSQCVDDVIYTHSPTEGKQRDKLRNLRIMKFSLRYIHGFAEAIHREYFYLWGSEQGRTDWFEAAFQWANITAQTDCLTTLKQNTLMNLAEMLRVRGDYMGALDYAWKALRVKPSRRDPWGVIAELELESGSFDRARKASELMAAIRKDETTGLPQSDRFIGERGLTLRTRCLRAAGYEKGAMELEDGVFQQGGARFSLLHATRGRPHQAIKARESFYRTAFQPIGIEHTFGIDADDKDSLQALKQYRHLIIDQPNGCVKAWNQLAAISQGKVLVQVSDDWQAPMHWDEAIWQALVAETKKRGGPEAEVGDVPLVVAVSDGHRKDDLLCMAIVTRARYEQQRDVLPTRNPLDPTADVRGEPYLFSPEYFSMFSDNEFTVRAFRDGVVLDLRSQIVFNHRHPVFEGKPVEQWDETYRRQNDSRHYEQGAAVFARRNKWWIEHQQQKAPQ